MTDFETKAAVVISQLRADRDRLLDAFDKIRDEIEEANNRCNNAVAKGCYLFCLGVINKYMEDKE